MLNESTSYLMIEVISETIENNERVIHRRKTCIGNPVEHFVTEEVIRVPVTKPKKEEVDLEIRCIELLHKCLHRLSKTKYIFLLKFSC